MMKQTNEELALANVCAQLVIIIIIVSVFCNHDPLFVQTDELKIPHYYTTLMTLTDKLCWFFFQLLSNWL